MKKAGIIPLIPFQSAVLPLKVQSISDHLQEQEEANEGPHHHNYYEMTWVRKGSGVLHADLQDYRVGGDTFFFLKPGQVHQFQTMPDMEGVVFSFTDDFFRTDEYDDSWDWENILFELFSERRMIGVCPEEAADLQAITSTIAKEMEGDYPNRIVLLRRYFKILLIYLTRSLKGEIRTREQSKEGQLVKQFLRLVDTQFKENKLVAEYAAQLLLTPNYLNKLVRQNTGFSAGHHIRQRVVLEAKRLGRFSRASVKEIAYELGFLDYAHFSRFFKVFSGTNFSEFKRDVLVVPLGATAGRA